MSNAILSWFKWSIISVALATLAAFVIPGRAQDATKPNAGFVDDWTHHHVVFSDPGSREDAVRHGTLDRWTQITNDPRYKLQQVKRTLGKRPVIEDTELSFGRDLGRGPRRDRGPQDFFPGGGVRKDWSAPLGGGATLGSGPAGSIGTLNGSTISNSSTLNIEVTFFFFHFDLLTLHATNSATNCTTTGVEQNASDNPPSFCYWDAMTGTYDSSAQVASNIAAVINASWLSQWFTATASGNGISLAFKDGGGDPVFISIVENNFSAFSSGTGGTLATVQPNAYPAKYSWSATTASCTSDFVVYPTGQAGGTAAANILAYNELYGSTPASGSGDGTGCDASGGVNVPTPYWAYNTGNGEMVSTSPILSMDGTQVAFMETSGTRASLVLLKWKQNSSASVSAPGAITTVTAANYRGCTAPCMVAMAFADGHDDASSAPYYDYIGDAIYVGDNSGALHEFTGVFNGTPAEAGSPWPVALGGQLSSPVYDATSGNIWVGNMSGTLYSVTHAGVLNGSTTIADAIADGPLIDGTAEQVYVFVGDCKVCTDANVDAVLQFPATGFAPVYFAELGTGAAGYYLYSGTFDNSYYQSTNPTLPTGYLYTMGNTSPAAGGGNLYQVPINGGSLGTPSAVSNGMTASGVSPWASPVTEYYNTTSGTDYIFVSLNAGTEIPYGCTTGADNGGCILSFSVNSSGGITQNDGQSLANVGGNGCWATGGISVDNSVAGDSDIYFISLNGAVAGSLDGSTSGNCGSSSPAIISAIQGTQAAP